MSRPPTSSLPDRGALRLANAEVHLLAEGPYWDPVRERLLWVDIQRGLVFRGRLDDDGLIEIEERVEFPTTVGSVAVAESGEWIVAAAEEIIVRSPAGSLEFGPRVLPAGSGRRLNDGKPDPAGRFVVGSLSLGGPSRQVLARVEADGSVTTIDDDLTLSNGLAWSADGGTLYSVDTGTQRIFTRSYDPTTGETGPRSVLVEFAHGHPDGICLDAEEHLWVAVWGLGAVHRYAPDGELVSVTKVPAPHTSSVAFAGPDLATLVVTTATQDLDATQLARSPGSGRIFTIVPGVCGLPQPLWSGEPRS